MRRPPALLALILVAGTTGCSGGEGASRPDLLLVTIDTLRADSLACYGGPTDVGSALCSVADRGIRYQWAIASAPSTAPSVASILTSLYPRDHGVTEFAISWLDEAVVTLAEVLSAAGYETAAFVSNPVLERSRQLGQGFETYDAHMTRREANRPGFAERDAEATTDAALAWLAKKLPPRFLWVHYQDPHGPYDPPGFAAPEPAGAEELPVLRHHSGKGGIPAYQALPGVTSVAAYLERYRNEIRYVDAQVTRLLAALPDAGVLVTSDHGEAFGEDGYYFAHGHSLGLDQIRVPLLWRPPGGTEPQVVAAAVATLDVAPTLVAAARSPAPEAFAGRPLPGADTEASNTRLFYAEHRARAAVLAGRRYYARDREDLGRGRRDRISGGVLEPMAPRTARLDEGPALPAYAAAEAQTPPQLESALVAFLAEAGRAPADAGELPEETREKLRALGYLE